MRKLILALTLVLCWPGYATAKDKDGKYMSRATTSCGQYVDDYDKDRRERSAPGKVTQSFAVQAGWLTGYLTAYNRWLDNGIVDIAEGVDNDSMEQWIANWCRAHPLEDMGKATEMLIVELRDRRTAKEINEMNRNLKALEKR